MSESINHEIRHVPSQEEYADIIAALDAQYRLQGGVRSFIDDSPWDQDDAETSEDERFAYALFGHIAEQSIPYEADISQPAHPQIEQAARAYRTGFWMGTKVVSLLYHRPLPLVGLAEQMQENLVHKLPADKHQRYVNGAKLHAFGHRGLDLIGEPAADLIRGWDNEAITEPRFSNGFSMALASLVYVDHMINLQIREHDLATSLGSVDWDALSREIDGLDTGE